MNIRMSHTRTDLHASELIRHWTDSREGTVAVRFNPLKRIRVHFLAFVLSATVQLLGSPAEPARPPEERSLETEDARRAIDGHGFTTSIAARDSGWRHSPTEHPSLLLGPPEGGRPDDRLLQPAAACFSAKTVPRGEFQAAWQPSGERPPL